jgi:hypothetical protein
MKNVRRAKSKQIIIRVASHAQHHCFCFSSSFSFFSFLAASWRLSSAGAPPPASLPCHTAAPAPQAGYDGFGPTQGGGHVSSSLPDRRETACHVFQLAGWLAGLIGLGLAQPQKAETVTTAAQLLHLFVCLSLLSVCLCAHGQRRRSADQISGGGQDSSSSLGLGIESFPHASPAGRYSHPQSVDQSINRSIRSVNHATALRIVLRSCACTWVSGSPCTCIM